MRNEKPATGKVIRLRDTAEAREARAWVARRLSFEDLLADLERRPRHR